LTEMKSSFTNNKDTLRYATDIHFYSDNNRM
jgi:hypothetical protein